MASGNPSRARQRSSTAPALSSSRTNWCRCCVARPAKRAVESASPSGSRPWTTSPSSPSGTWLVASTVSPGAASSSRATSDTTPSTTCSQLSSSRSDSAPANRSASISSPPDTCRVSATTRGIDAAGSTPSSRTSHAPPAWLHPAGHLDRRTRLAHAGAADHGHQSVLPHKPAQRRQLVDPAHQLGGERRQVPEPARHHGPSRVGAQGRALLEDLLLEAAQAGSGIHSELVEQQAAHPRVRRQRVRLATRAVERCDQRRPQALAQGVLLHQGLELADRVATGSQCHPRGHPVLDQAEAYLVEAGPVRLQPVAVPRVAQHVAPEQRQGLGRRRDRGGGIALAA